MALTIVNLLQRTASSERVLRKRRTYVDKKCMEVV